MMSSPFPAAVTLPYRLTSESLRATDVGLPTGSVEVRMQYSHVMKTETMMLRSSRRQQPGFTSRGPNCFKEAGHSLSTRCNTSLRSLSLAGRVQQPTLLSARVAWLCCASFCSCSRSCCRTYESPELDVLAGQQVTKRSQLRRSIRRNVLGN